MKSKLIKVLHPLAGIPLIEHVLRSVRNANVDDIYVVVGHQRELVEESLEGVTCVTQYERLGTGDAVEQCRSFLEDFDGPVIVTCGDVPLMRPETFQNIISLHNKKDIACTMVTAMVEQPHGYGRIVRSPEGRVEKIVEQKDASEDELKINEINTGTYCFNAKLLFKYLKLIDCNNAQGEYYLTDVVPLLLKDGYTIEGYCLEDPRDALGVNDRIQFAEVENVIRDRIRKFWMLNGVSILDPGSTYIDVDCTIGQDTIIFPGTFIERGTQIGEDCRIGPNVRLQNTKIGNSVTIEFAKSIDAAVSDEAQIGPFAYLRPGATIGKGCRIGDFVEIKNSNIGDYSKVPHLSYIGDADVGENVNIGCGTITCNYDGKTKSRTVIENNAFIGSNSNLVAPVRIGESSYVAAGSTITEDVPKDSLAIARERQVNKEGWKKRRATGDTESQQ